MKEYYGALVDPGPMAIIVSEYYEKYTQGLRQGALKVLHENHIDLDQIETFYVPGSFEIASLTHLLAKTKKYRAICCLGLLIRGKTKHFDLIAEQVALGIYEASKEYDVPISYGVLTLESVHDAPIRCEENSEHNRGREAMIAALKMANLYLSIQDKN